MATDLTLLSPDNGDLFLIKIAREIAIDHYSVEDILKRYDIDAKLWDEISHNKRFQDVLRSEIAAWQSASNTKERVELKASAMIEEWLPEAYARMHDEKDTLSAKVELAKLIARIGNLGDTKNDIAGMGEKFSVTINLGADSKLNFEKEGLPSKVINAEPTGA